ncbi:MAG: putative rane-anchored cell surface protein, partial [Variovorax sp.]|nr:putative rane-anchored cell surface protein [Variovorax sp.]
MNKSYRSIWNRSLGAWIAVPEGTHARGKPSGARCIGAAVSSMVLLAGTGAMAQQIDYANGTNNAAPIAITGANATLNSLDAGAAIQSGVISGTAGQGIVKTGAGTLVLGATNTYGGPTAINGGTLQVSSDANLGAASGGLSFSNNAALQFGANN